MTDDELRALCEQHKEIVWGLEGSYKVVQHPLADHCLRLLAERDAERAKVAALESRNGYEVAAEWRDRFVALKARVAAALEGTT